MARFSFCRLVSLASQGAPLEPLSPRTEASTFEPVGDPQPCGPGWFDSSWDLHCGLVVREGLPGDARLHEWLMAALV
jgi:hypothetical protein